MHELECECEMSRAAHADWSTGSSNVCSGLVTWSFVHPVSNFLCIIAPTTSCSSNMLDAATAMTMEPEHSKMCCL